MSQNSNSFEAQIFIVFSCKTLKVYSDKRQKKRQGRWTPDGHVLHSKGELPFFFNEEYANEEARRLTQKYGHSFGVAKLNTHYEVAHLPVEELTFE